MKFAIQSGAALLLAMASFVTAEADSRHVSVAPMQLFPGSDNAPGVQDRAVLLRGEKELKLNVSTSGLDPTSPYTVWAVIFNKPQYCLATPCGIPDLPIVPGHDPRVEASIVYAGGGVSDAQGRGKFVGRVYENRGAPSIERLFGFGLLDAKRAEVHLVVRGHGHPSEDDIFAAVGSFAGGCNAQNAAQPPCEDQQFSIHEPR